MSLSHSELFQRSHDIVRSEESLYAIAEYILNNPVRQGFVEHTEDWPWSGHMNPLPTTNT